MPVEPGGRRITAGMQRAWDWAQTTQAKGLSATKGLEILKERGMGIRRSDWLWLRRQVTTASFNADMAMKLPLSTRLGEGLFTTSPMRFTGPYEMKVLVRFYDTSREQWTEEWKTATSPTPRSRESFLGQIELIMNKSLWRIRPGSITYLQYEFWRSR